MGVLQKVGKKERESISIADASTILHARGSYHSLPTEYISYSEAMGRILAEDIYPAQDVPNVDLSTCDGYVVNTNDIIDNSFAGHGVIECGSDALMLKRPNAMRILSGAPVPLAANMVVPEEQCMILTKNPNGSFVVLLQGKAVIGQGIRTRASYFRRNECLLKKGSRIDLAAITLLSCLSIKKISVYKTVSISIGYNSSEQDVFNQKKALNLFLSKVLKHLTVNIAYEEYIPQEKQAIQDFIRRATQSSNIILTIGGISSSYESIFSTVLNEWKDIEMHFQQVASMPGKVFACASTNNNIPILCLPGNLLACITTFLWFVIPCLSTLQGKSDVNNICYTVSSPIGFESDSRTRFLFARSEITINGFSVEILPEQNSTALSNLRDANGLLIVPANQVVQRGYPLQYFPISDITKHVFC